MNGTRKLGLFLGASVIALTAQPSFAQSARPSPADGHTIHVVAPHMMNGKIMGPYHHYCKAVNDSVIECLIYDTDKPDALLTQVEYFVAKDVTKKNVPLNVWNQFYHDHKIEIATGRVKVLDADEATTKKIVDIASKTDGIVFSLWPEGAKAPNGVVQHPQAVGHKALTKAEYEDPNR